MLKYITHENGEDGRSTVLTLEDEQGVRHELLWDYVPRQQIDEERTALAYLNHDIKHWGYKPPECCHCLQFNAFSPQFCGLNHPMDYFRVYCGTCPDVNKKVETVFNKKLEPKFLPADEIDWSKMKLVEPQPPTQEEIEKKRRENHCTK
jgi:hypothetical protein